MTRDPAARDSTGPNRGRSASQLDRAAGVLMGAAWGDALGVPYEFAPRLGPDATPAMIGRPDSMLPTWPLWRYA